MTLFSTIFDVFFQLSSLKSDLDLDLPSLKSDLYLDFPSTEIDLALGPGGKMMQKWEGNLQGVEMMNECSISGRNFHEIN